MFSLWRRWRPEQAQTRPRRLPSGRGQGRRVRPELEALEDRCLPSFLAPFPYASGSIPTSVAVGDFNHDGNLDLAVANAGDGTVSVFLGNGAGAFAHAVTYHVGSNPLSVTVGDFDGDFIPDLAVANSDDGTVTVLLGNGNGTFQDSPSYLAQHTFAAGTYLASVAVGDFTSDRALDLVVANFTSGTVSVLLGNGDGTFGAPVPYLAGMNPRSVAVGDFNRDGNLDLAVANDKGSVSVLLGNGNGAFGPPKPYTAGTGAAESVAVGEFDGDGFPDLAVTNHTSNTVSVLLNNGAGAFAPAVPYPVGMSPSSVAVGDFNGDGIPDLAVANRDSGDVSVLLGKGDGTFAPAVPYPVGMSPSSVAVGDFNRDGSPDLAVANFTGGTVSVLLNASATRTAVASSDSPAVVGQPVTFTATVTAPLAAGTPTGSITFRDGGTALGSAPLDGSGRARLTVTLAPGSHAITARYLGDGNFNASASAPLAQAVINPPIRDVTTLVSISRANVRRARNGRYQQTLTLTNTGGSPLAGPLELVLDGLSLRPGRRHGRPGLVRTGIALRQQAGVTAALAPLGSPFMAVSAGSANVFSAGATLTVMLEFSNPFGRRLVYLPRLLAGPGTP